MDIEEPRSAAAHCARNSCRRSKLKSSSAPITPKDLWCFPAVGLSAHHRLAQSLPKACQGLGKPQSQGASILAPRINPPRAPKTL